MNGALRHREADDDAEARDSLLARERVRPEERDALDGQIDLDEDADVAHERNRNRAEDARPERASRDEVAHPLGTLRGLEHRHYRRDDVRIVQDAVENARLLVVGERRPDPLEHLVLFGGSRAVDERHRERRLEDGLLQDGGVHRGELDVELDIL